VGVNRRDQQGEERGTHATRHNRNNSAGVGGFPPPRSHTIHTKQAQHTQHTKHTHVSTQEPLANTKKQEQKSKQHDVLGYMSP
jgi:hypothetical protein